MYVVGREEMNQLDQYMIGHIGLPEAVLMENAGAQVVDEVIRLCAARRLHVQRASILVLAGHGHNGGDGFVIARRLLDRGINALVCFISPQEKLRGQTAVQFKIYRELGLPLWLLENHGIDDLVGQIKQADIVVDALLGTGVRQEVRSPYREVIRLLNEYSPDRCIVSVDLPSGLCADTGKALGEAVKATYTVTFAFPKRGFFVQDGPHLIGKWKSVDISLPESLVKRLQLHLPQMITPPIVCKALPSRPVTGHKGTFGHLLVVGGSRHYIGAPLFAAQAGLESGAGLVSLAVPENIYPYVAGQEPHVIYQPLATENGHLGQRAVQTLLETVDQYDALVVGPGLGRWPAGGSWLIKWLNERSTPTVVDADALFLLRDHLHLLDTRRAPLILTPHPGEMAHLIGSTVKEVEADRLGVAQSFARRYGIYLILKGHRTIVATPEGEMWINPLGHDALAKGGSGDVLAGMVASFLAQGKTAEEAGVAAVYLHALAADRCARRRSRRAVLAHDLIRELGPSMLKLLEDREEVRLVDQEEDTWL